VRFDAPWSFGAQTFTQRDLARSLPAAISERIISLPRAQARSYAATRQNRSKKQRVKRSAKSVRQARAAARPPTRDHLRKNTLRKDTLRKNMVSRERAGV